MDTEAHSLHGILAIDKPPGLTSRDVVNRVVTRLRQDLPKPAKLPKVGHAGTLDPLASGVLLVGVGAGVRLVPYLQQQSKHYHAVFRLGQSSASGDLETELIDQPDPPMPSHDQLQKAADGLTGEITQIPPAHSAIKVGGRKAYKFAHRGQDVVVPPRQVQVDRYQITQYQYPDVTAQIVCGSGTYVRTLGIDLAARSGTTAVMTRLIRTAIGAYGLAETMTVDQLNEGTLQQWLLPLAGGVVHLPTLSVDAESLQRLINGQKLAIDTVAAGDGSGAEHLGDAATEAAVFDTDHQLRVIVQLRSGLWCPYRVFPAVTRP